VNSAEFAGARVGIADAVGAGDAVRQGRPMNLLQHRLSVAFALILLPSFLAAPSARGQGDQSRIRFHASLDLVTIQASVRDHRGRPMKGLTGTDFEIRDNGELRPVLSLRADARSPISLGILIDTSGSMRLGPKLAMARQAFDAIASQLRGGDEIALFTFDSALHQRMEFTREPGPLSDVWSDIEPFGTTSLYDATADAARKVAARSATHKAIILLTDGVDTSSTLSAPQVSGIASSIDVPVYVVATIPSVDQDAMLQQAKVKEVAGGEPRSRSADLHDLAEWTGGQLVFATTPVEAAAIAFTVISELRQQYVLAIEAAQGREWRRLDVRVRRRAATVKARNGYFAG
jgi:VWFA-related protein